jgi:hypothetical protein
MKATLTALLFAIVSIATAQKLNVTYSEKVAPAYSANLQPMGNGFIGYVTPGKKFERSFKVDDLEYSVTLYKKDAYQNLITEHELYKGERVFGPYQPLLRNINGTFYLVYSKVVDKDGIAFKIYISELDTTTLDLKPETELFTVDEASLGKFKTGQDMRGSTSFFIETSPDKKRLLFLWSSGLTNTFFVHVTDSQLATIFTKKQVTDNGVITIKKALIDDAGNVWWSYLADKYAAEGRYSIAKMKSDGRVTEKKIDLKTDKTFDVYLTQTPDKVIASGLVANNDWLVIGAYSQSFDKTSMNNTPVVQKEVPAKLIQQFDNDGWALTRKNKYGMFGVGMFAHTLSDGSIAMIGHYQKREWGTRTVFEYAGSFFYVKIKKDDIVFARIPKLRVSAGSTIGSSFFSMPYKDKLLVFYDDSQKNLDRNIEDNPARSDNYNYVKLVMATVDDRGEVTRNIVIDKSNESYLPLAEDITMLTPTRLLIPIRKIGTLGGLKGDFMWGWITISD